MSRTKITVEGTGELLHEGPTAPDAWERLCAAERQREESYRRPVLTSWGLGWFDVRRPLRYYVENEYMRPVR